MVFSRKLLGRAGLLGPALIIIGVFMLVPLGLMAYVSILERGEYGGVIWDAHTPEAYLNFFLERNLDGTLEVNTDY
ncbi:MAG: hypothetical protein WAL83_08575, partial [Arenicellales bacterium]